jgi:hypothetical protein
MFVGYMNEPSIIVFSVSSFYLSPNFIDPKFSNLSILYWQYNEKTIKTCTSSRCSSFAYNRKYKIHYLSERNEANKYASMMNSGNQKRFLFNFQKAFRVFLYWDFLIFLPMMVLYVYLLITQFFASNPERKVF